MNTLAAVETLVRWKRDPVAFVREAFDAEPDAWQADVLGAFPTHNRIAMKAAKGPGKTTVLAWCIWNFLATRPHANVAATSISGDNLKDGLWKELAKWQQRSPLLLAAFDWQRERIVSREAPATWWASARQWSKSANAQEQSLTLAGLHSDYAMFVLDESAGIPMSVMSTVEAVLSTGLETKVMQAGNPTTLEGPLYRACVVDRGLCYVVDITGDPDDPRRSPRIDLEWAKQQIATYGRDSGWVRVNVLAQFPPASLNSLLGPEDVRAAMARVLEPSAYEWSQKRIGLDVARYGDDRTVLAPRQGLMWFDPVIMRHERGSAVSTDIAARALKGKAAWGAEFIICDGTGGWSAGAMDVMRTGGESPIDVQFHAPALDPRFANRRAEMWWAMADAVKTGAALPNIPELIGELTAVTYTFHNGKFQLEPKEQVKQRLGRSPDLADAYALTYALPDMPGSISISNGRGERARALVDYDPWERAGIR